MGTADRAARAAAAMRLDNINSEMTAQRTLIGHLILMVDKHDYELQRFRPTRALYFGVDKN